MSVDFTPNQSKYSDVGEFRIWCQKVLPLVYDDSISYYELLCKVVKYLNDTVNNQELVGDDMVKLYKAYSELQNWINLFFDNLDVTKELTGIVEKMEKNGYFDNVINVEKYEALKKDITALFNSVQLGSPSGTANSVTDLTAMYPNGTNGYYVIGSEWYYWNGSTWVDGGAWNNATVGKRSVKPVNVSGAEVFEFLDTGFLISGSYITSTGSVESSVNSTRYEVTVSPGSKAVIVSPQDVVGKGYWVFLNGSGNVVSSFFIEDCVQIAENMYVIDVPPNATRVSVNSKVLNEDYTGKIYLGMFDYSLYKKYLFGYNVFTDENQKAYVTDVTNLSGLYTTDKIILGYGSRTVGETRINNNSSNMVALVTYAELDANTVYCISRPASDNTLGGAVMVYNDGSTEVILMNTLESGYTIVTGLGDRISKKFTPTKGGIIFLNVVLGEHLFGSYNTFIGTPDYDYFPSNPYIKEINGMRLLSEKRDIETNFVSVLKGKKISVIGDSITEKNSRANKNWVDYLVNTTGCTVQNLGVSGTGFTRNYSNSSNYIGRISEVDTDTDIIGVSASFNDMGSNLPVGEASDTGTTTICGYINAFFDELLNKFPTTPICCYVLNAWRGIPPMISTTSDNYVSKLELICKRRAIPFVALYDKCNLRPWDSANNVIYFTPPSGDEADGVHPNDEGHKLLFKGLYPLFVSCAKEVALDYEIETK